MTSGLWLSLSVATAATPGHQPDVQMDCSIGAVHAALRGDAPPPHERALQPPAALQDPRSPPPPSAEKALYGGRMANHVDSANFTIAWADGDADTQIAEQLSADMERAWTAFIDENGWPAPVSSDQYLLWVLLDPTLSGTGLTTEYSSDAFPDGYPVIYVNPGYASHAAFFGSLGTHEFMHAVQYGLRDYASGAGEAWYWEASAEWAAEQARADLDTYAWSSEWYATHPEYAYDSMQDYHQYGMFLLNAWVEEFHSDEYGMLNAWLISADLPGQPWDIVLEEALGLSAPTLWASFSSAVGNAELRESAIYTTVVNQGPVADGTQARLPYLGTHFYTVDQDASVRVVPASVAELGAPWGTGDAVEVFSGDILSVTVTAPAGETYALELGAPDAFTEPATPDTGETGDSGDAGEAGRGAIPTQETGCGCAQGTPGRLPIAPLLLALGVITRRRRGRMSPSERRPAGR